MKNKEFFRLKQILIHKKHWNTMYILQSWSLQKNHCLKRMMTQRNSIFYQHTGPNTLVQIHSISFNYIVFHVLSKFSVDLMSCQCDYDLSHQTAIYYMNTWCLSKKIYTVNIFPVAPCKPNRKHHSLLCVKKCLIRETDVWDMTLTLSHGKCRHTSRYTLSIR